MSRVMRMVVLCALLVWPRLLSACDCAVVRSVCQEVADTELIFIGRVESITPDGAGKALHVHFKILTLFQHKQDDDQADTKDKAAPHKDEELEEIDIWEPLSDCRICFQPGELYLVYADDDEQTGRSETNVCYRTTRLSDAGDDLPYLYFFQNGGAHSLRVEGFVTSAINQLSRDRFHYAAKVASPVADVVVELKAGPTVRDIEPDAGGRFVFDGLAAGDYELSVFRSGYPEHVVKLSGPKKIHLVAGRCDLFPVYVAAGVSLK